MKSLKYTIPVWLYLTLLCLTWADAVPYYFLLLIALTLVETLLGEFREAELRQELKFFYGDRRMQQVKMAGALLLAGFNGALLCFIASHRPDSWSFVVLLLATTYSNGTFMLPLAHDFSHAASNAKHWLSNLLLFVLCLPFFRADHIFGHHEQVGTPYDESSARLNQSFYDFLARAFLQRIKRSYSRRSDLPAAHKSGVLRSNYLFTTLLAGFGGMLFFIQPVLLWFWLGQSVLVYILYELTNYIQHYGLRRSPGEAVDMGHSWNSYFKYSNYTSWFLLVHSPHHVGRPLHKVESLIGPRLPFSAAYKMLLFALVPRLWFRVMNPLVSRVQKRQNGVAGPVFHKLPAIEYLNTHQNHGSYDTQS